MTAPGHEPAFPNRGTRWVNEDTGASGGVGGSVGMSRRDFLAAHAPAEPQPWFQPKLGKLPDLTAPPRVSPESAMSRVVRDVLQGDCDSEDIAKVYGTGDYGKGPIVDAEVASVLAWARKREANIEERQAIEKANARLRFILWPYAWADAVIAADELMAASEDRDCHV